MLSPKVTICTTCVTLHSDIPSCTQLFQPPVYEELLYAHDDKGTLCKVSSDSLLLNAERLGNLLGADTARAVIDGMRDSLARPSVSDGDSLSDEQIIDFIRDRGIQSRAEMRAWIDAIDARSTDIKDYFAYLKMQSKADSSKADTSKADSSKADTSKADTSK